jgi:hypothetical protein
MKSFRISRQLRRVGIAVAALAAAAVSAGLMASDAQAYGRIGAWAPPTVTCDTFYQGIHVRAHFGASRDFWTQPQYLRYRYYIHDIDRGTGFWTAFTQPFPHVPVYVSTGYGGGTVIEYRDWAPIPEWYRTLGPGRFQLYYEYQWYDGGWFRRAGWVTEYQGFYYVGGGAFCRTSTVAG